MKALIKYKQEKKIQYKQFKMFTRMILNSLKVLIKVIFKQNLILMIIRIL